jgi:hypothetical protein
MAEEQLEPGTYKAMQRVSIIEVCRDDEVIFTGSTPEAREYFGVDQKTIDNWRRKGHKKRQGKTTMKGSIYLFKIGETNVEKVYKKKTKKLSAADFEEKEDKERREKESKQVRRIRRKMQLERALANLHKDD